MGTTIYVNDINYQGYVEPLADQYVELDASLSGVTYELPEITENIIGNKYVIKASSVLSGVTILPYSSNTIDGSGSYIFGLLSGQSVTLQAETGDWKIVSEYQPILNLDLNSPINFDFLFDQFSEYLGGITRYAAIAIPIPNDGATWSAESRNEVYLQNEFTYDVCQTNSVTTGFIPDLIWRINESSGYIYVDLRIIPGLPAEFPNDTTHLESPQSACPGYYTGYARLNITRNSVVVKVITINYVMDLQPILE